VHILVVGCGRVGSELAMDLSDEGHSVVVIDRNKDAFRRLTRFSGTTIVGSGFDRETLLQADARSADALAAVTNGDNSNILTARIARDNFQIKNVVARIYDPNRAEIYMKLGIPTVASAKWTSLQVKRWILPNDASREWTDSTGRLHLVERVLPDVLAGKPIKDFNISDDVRVVGIVRGTQARVDIDGLYAQEDDVLEFMVTNEGAADLDRFMKGLI
jgi:trk system potassium uptake protein TrkA